MDRFIDEAPNNEALQAVYDQLSPNQKASEKAMGWVAIPKVKLGDE